MNPLQQAMRSALPNHLATTRQTQSLLQRRALLSTSTCRRTDSTKASPSTSSASPDAKAQSVKTAVGEESQNGNPELPKFSLDGLGVSKNMKIFLIVVLSIFGTMETWFYCKAIYRWWYGEQGLAVTEDNQ